MARWARMRRRGIISLYLMTEIKAYCCWIITTAIHRNLTLSHSRSPSHSLLAFAAHSKIWSFRSNFFRVLIAIQSFIKIKLLPTVSSLTHSLLSYRMPIALGILYVGYICCVHLFRILLLLLLVVCRHTCILTYVLSTIHICSCLWARAAKSFESG